MSALANWLVPGGDCDLDAIQKNFTPEQLEKFRKDHWHEYFVALRALDSEAAKQHREIAEELERLRSHGSKELLDLMAGNGDLYISDKHRAESQSKNPRAPSTLLINREHVRRFLLERAKSQRAHKFKRVSEATLQLANEMLRQWLIGHVNRMPSKGQTL